MLLVLVVLLGCPALVACTVKAPDTPIQEEAGGADNTLRAINPDGEMLTITERKPFKIGTLTYAGGWKISKKSGSFNVTGVEVTNICYCKDEAKIEIKLWNGNQVVALADCTTKPIGPKEMTPLSCSSADKVPKSYDKITVNTRV